MTRTIAGKVFSRVKHELTVGIERTYVYSCSSRDRVVLVELPANVEIRRIEPAAIPTIGAIGTVEAEEWVERLQRGDECYGAWVSGDLAHYSWVQSSGDHIIGPAGRTASVEPGTFCIYNCRTADRYRGMRLYPRALSVILADYFARGRSEAWIYTTQSNVASQHGILRAGFKQVEELRALRLGRWLRPLGESETFPRISATAQPSSSHVVGAALVGN